MKRAIKDNKGFSLVELIIVIAIMAILVGIIGSQVIPYLEKSKVSKDVSTLDTAYSNFQSALADQAAKTGTTPQCTGAMDTATEASFAATAGMASATLANKLTSKKATTGTINFYSGSTAGSEYIAVKSNQLWICSIDGSGQDTPCSHCQ